MSRTGALVAGAEQLASRCVKKFGRSPDGAPWECFCQLSRVFAPFSSMPASEREKGELQSDGANGARDAFPYRKTRSWGQAPTCRRRCMTMAAKADATQPFNPMFPNAVARDPCLSPVGLFLAAYRSTFAGKYKLIPHRLGHLARRGLGKNAATAGIAEMRAAGVLKRWQPPGPPGAFCEVEEELCLPEGNGRFVSRAWFDGKLDVAEMAALIFLRAGTGRGPKTYRRELQKRFGWAPGTARRVIDGLMGRSLLDKTVRRKADGTHLSTTYTVPKLAADMLARSGVQNSGNANSSTAQKPGDTNPGRANPGRANPGRANPGNYTYTPPYEPPSEDSPHVLPSAECPHAPDQGLEKYAFRASRGLAPTISDLKLDKLHQVAQAESDLLGWIGVSDGVSEAVFEDAPSDEATRAVYEVVSDSKLREALRQATDQRIAYVLLEPAGLYTVRWLAAFLMSKAEETADGDSVPSRPLRPWPA